MRVLAIGSDRSIFDPESESAQRQIAYGKRFGTLEILVFSLRQHKKEALVLAEGVQVYPTASRTRWFYVWDAFMMGRSLMRPDIITVQDPFESGLVGALLSWWHRVPLHVQVHTDLYDPAFARSPLNRLRLVIAAFVFRRATRIRAVSDRVQSSILKRNPHAQVSVLPIFVDIASYRNTAAGELAERFSAFSTKVLIVARLEPEKNIELAIASFTHAAREDACLIIVGDGSERAALEKQASSRVFFEGRRDARPYYAIANLVIVTSLYEGYGRTIVEALAAGKPVLSTDVGVAREVGAIIADADFATSLARWFSDGEREGHLRGYPYNSFAEYVQQYCADVDETLNKSHNSF